MAYNGFTTSNFFVETGAAPVTAAPLTMCCWFNSTSILVNQGLLAIQRASDSDYFGLAASGNVAGDPVVAYINGASAGNVTLSTTTGYSANTWHHACAVFTSATSRAVFLDGGGKTTNTTSRTPTGLTKLNIGVYQAGGSAFDAIAGSIAEIGIWNDALTDAEVASLAKGVSPALIRPQSLVRYRPFVRSTQCVRSNTTLAATGAPTVATHTRIYKSA
jgi:hypothetical protein